jgi:hypothetical protein
MKNKFLITVSYFVVVFLYTIHAQDIVNAKTAGYDLKKNVKVRVIENEVGSAIQFEFAEVGIRESPSKNTGTTGKATPKLMEKVFLVNASNNQVSEVVSPRDPASGLATGKRDAASGLPTGKRQHKPVSVTKELDKSSPLLAKGTGSGAGKVSLQDFHFVMKVNNKDVELPSSSGETVFNTDLPNGTYELAVSWSWGANNAGSSSAGTGLGVGKAKNNRSHVDFFIEIKDGVCMAINQKGTPGSSKPI